MCVCLCLSVCHSPCIRCVWSVRPQKTQVPVYPLTFLSSYYQTQWVSVASHSPSRPFPFTYNRCLSYALFVLFFFCYCCRSLLSYEVVLIMFHLHSPPSVFVCAPYWYSSLFCFPLEKLASFDGLGKTTKREALTILLFSLPIYFVHLLLFAFTYLSLTLPTPSPCLNFSPTHSFHVGFSIPFRRNKEVFVLCLCLFRSTWMHTQAHAA